MALVKKIYTDNQTVITAENLNDIQDEIIANAGEISSLNDKIVESSERTYNNFGDWLKANASDLSYPCKISLTINGGKIISAMIAKKDNSNDYVGMYTSNGADTYEFQLFGGVYAEYGVALKSDLTLKSATNWANAYANATSEIIVILKATVSTQIQNYTFIIPKVTVTTSNIYQNQGFYLDSSTYCLAQIAVRKDNCSGNVYYNGKQVTSASLEFYYR